MPSSESAPRSASIEPTAEVWAALPNGDTGVKPPPGCEAGLPPSTRLAARTWLQRRAGSAQPPSHRDLIRVAPRVNDDLCEAGRARNGLGGLVDRHNPSPDQRRGAL